MRRRPFLFTTALVVTALSFLSPAAPAQAAQATVKMTFDAAPEPAVKGSTIKLTGRVWLHSKGNKIKVNFYFQKSGDPAAAYVYQGDATATDAGNFTRKFVATTTGTWKAVSVATTKRKSATSVDAVQVVQRQSQDFATYGPLSGNWMSPTIRIPSAVYQAVVTYTCEDDGFLFVVWNGQPDVGEAEGSDLPGGTVTLNGDQGARSGYFEVFTEVGCSWKLRLTSTVTTQV